MSRSSSIEHSLPLDILASMTIKSKKRSRCVSTSQPTSSAYLDAYNTPPMSPTDIFVTSPEQDSKLTHSSSARAAQTSISSDRVLSRFWADSLPSGERRQTPSKFFAPDRLMSAFTMEPISSTENTPQPTDTAPTLAEQAKPSIRVLSSVRNREQVMSSCAENGNSPNTSTRTGEAIFTVHRTISSLMFNEEVPLPSPGLPPCIVTTQNTSPECTGATRSREQYRRNSSRFLSRFMLLRSMIRISGSTPPRSSIAVDRFSPIQHIHEMLNSEPQRPERRRYTDRPSALYRALALMWDGGEIVLRSIRVRATEIDEVTRDSLVEFFAPFLNFTAAYLNSCPSSPSRDTLIDSAQEFEDTIVQADCYYGVLLASEAGYRFRDALLHTLSMVEDDMVPLTARCFAVHPQGVIALTVLALGYKRDMISRRNWVLRVLHPTKSGLALQRALPRSAKHMWRRHKCFVRQFNIELQTYLAIHRGEKFGFVRRQFNRALIRCPLV